MLHLKNTYTKPQVHILEDSSRMSVQILKLLQGYIGRIETSDTIHVEFFIQVYFEVTSLESF